MRPRKVISTSFFIHTCRITHKRHRLVYLLIIISLLLADDDEIEDKMPLSKLGIMKKKDNTHLRLVQRVEDLKAKVELTRTKPPTPLDLSGDRYGVGADLLDLQDMLSRNPLDEEKITRRIEQVVFYWEKMYEEPRPRGLQELILHLRDLQGRLESQTSTSTEADATKEYRHCLDDLGIASSQARAALGRHNDEVDKAQRQQEMEGQEAAKLEARAKEHRLKEAESLERSNESRANAKIEEDRLKQLEECEQVVRTLLENVEDPVSRGIALILAYTVPGAN